jgi:hypothetical protein
MQLKSTHVEPLRTTQWTRIAIRSPAPDRFAQTLLAKNVALTTLDVGDKNQWMRWTETLPTYRALSLWMGIAWRIRKQECQVNGSIFAEVDVCGGVVLFTA